MVNLHLKSAMSLELFTALIAMNLLNELAYYLPLVVTLSPLPGIDGASMGFSFLCVLGEGKVRKSQEKSAGNVGEISEEGSRESQS